MEDILYNELAEEFDLLPFKTVYAWPEKKQNAYYAEIREWLTDILDDDSIIELPSGFNLKVLREVPKGTDKVYLTVKGNTERIVYAIREFE